MALMAKMMTGMMKKMKRSKKEVKKVALRPLEAEAKRLQVGMHAPLPPQ